MLLVCTAIFSLTLVRVFAGQAAVREVGSIGLTVNDLSRQLQFYTNTLPFELISISERSGNEQDDLLNLKSVRLRTATLKLGDESISLTEHVRRKGKGIPQDSRSIDLWFQHIAIVVSDMDEAYQQLQRHKVKHVSTAPQTLPDSNKDAGGIKAFYFHDPEDHVLEIIWFPHGKGNPRWQQSDGRLFLGIDHTAIVVSDTERSLAFYRDMLGMRVTGGAENFGVEQEHLNQVFGARLRITALRAERGPGIEFLEYITPPGGRGLPEDARANDLIFWNTQLIANAPSELARLAPATGGAVLSRSKRSQSPASDVIIRDPDGHALRLTTSLSQSSMQRWRP